MIQYEAIIKSRCYNKPPAFLLITLNDSAHNCQYLNIYCIYHLADIRYKQLNIKNRLVMA
jgi:hypothetical protein